MKLGVIGLGRMGMAIAQRALAGGHEVLAFDPNKEAQRKATNLGISIATSGADVAKQVQCIWVMVPAGKPVDMVIKDLQPHLQKGAILIDGGNSNFHDTTKRAAELLTQGIYFLDCGTSGGLRGKEIGFSLMIGGEHAAFEKVKPIFKAIAAPGGYAYLGQSGAGHYVKTIHNGIEYAILQSYAEGFHLLKKNDRYTDLDLARITSIWCNGSVIRSWILELCHEIFIQDQNLEEISGAVAEGMTGRWTVEEAQEQSIPVDLIKRALEIRGWSRETGGNYATKVVAMLRNKFGGHKVEKK